MITGNKGEWSEVYTLFKLLSDQKLYTGDSDLNKIETIFYPIIKIIRNESGGNFEYELDNDIVIISGGVETLRIPVKIFKEQTSKLFQKIKTTKGVFSIPEIEAFMTSIHCSSVKAKSTSKTDIRIVIHDQKINQTAELGFSIKSQIGKGATLLNAGKTTNFIYKIIGYVPTEKEINTINNIGSKSKIKDRLETIHKNNGTLKFVSLQQQVFNNNLVLIDSLLPNIIAEIIKLFYTTKGSSIKNLTEEISRINPLNFDTQYSHLFYEYKIKRFLTDIALGMIPSKVWSGVYDATGGYLVVKENGDVLCYHLYNRNLFEDYLYNNTKLETASSTKHDFAQIIHENGEYYFKLNLQIRFK